MEDLALECVCLTNVPPAELQTSLQVAQNLKSLSLLCCGLQTNQVIAIMNSIAESRIENINVCLHSVDANVYESITQCMTSSGNLQVFSLDCTSNTIFQLLLCFMRLPCKWQWTIGNCQDHLHYFQCFAYAATLCKTVTLM